VPTGFTNAGLIELTNTSINQPATLTLTAGTLVNTGAIQSLAGVGGGARTITAELANQATGTVSVSQPLTIARASAVHSNSGTIDASGADLTLNQTGTTPSFTNTGTVTVGPGRTWTISQGTFTQQTGATLNGGGALTLNSLTAANFNSNIAIGALNVNSTNPMNLGSGVNLSTATTALIFFNSTVNGPGTITNAASQTLSLKGTNITATSAVNNQGTLLVNGNVTIGGTLTTAAGSTLRLDGTTSFATLNMGNLTNNGAIELTSTGGVFNANLNISSTWTNAAGGTITSFPGTGGGRSVTTLNNLGTITVLSGSSSAGILQVNGGLTTSGTINLEIGGATLGTGYSQLTASAALNLGGTLNVGLIGGFVPTGGTTFTSLVGPRGATTFATANLPGGWSAPTYNVSSVVLTAP
jgi:hypothetical protein